MVDFDDHLEKYFDVFKELLKDKKEFLIIIHNNPDPDALASAFALSFLAENIIDIKTSIAYGGNLGRIENKTMVSKLHIRLKRINRIKFSKYDLIALVDTQPKAGNNSFPDTLGSNIVIDHHPKREDTKADLVIINPDIGATASILVSWLKYSGINMPSDVATALSYAISSETQNMYREATVFDIESYLFVYQKCSIRKLASIINPGLPHNYYQLFANALKNALLYRNLIISHIGEVASPEFVAEMADFLIRHRHVSWCLCTGLYDDLLYLSLRSKRRNAKANKIIKALVENKDNVGGHNQTAGGFIKLYGDDKKTIQNIYDKINNTVALKIVNKNPKGIIEYKPLMDNENSEGM